MRADRLISMILLLQSHGRMTADDLARRLEVSKRTIFRDVDALSYAGVPVYTQTGSQGGIYLDENYRVSLTGLSRSEVQSLFASIDSRPLKDLGLSGNVESTLMKLLANLPGMHRQAVTQMQQRFYIDTAGWFQVTEDTPYLAQLQQAVQEDRCVVIDYEHSLGTIDTVEIAAIALVSKVNIWYLVGRKASGDLRNYRISRLHALTVLDRYFDRDPEFDLKAYWQESCRIFEDEMRQQSPPYPVLLRVHQSMLWYFPYFLAGRYERERDPDPDGWMQVRVMFSSPEEARNRIPSMGAQVMVVDPPELREAILDGLREILAVYESET